MTKWKQLDAVLSTEAGAVELRAVLDGMDTEAEERVRSGETPGGVPMCPDVKRLLENTANQLLTPVIVVFASHPTSESFRNVQTAACASSLAWLIAGYCLGRQHADVIEGNGEES